MFNKIIFEKQFWIVRHLAFWLFLYLDEFLSLLGLTLPYEGWTMTIVQLCLDIPLIYIILYFCIPNFYLKKKYYSFIISIVGLILIASLIYVSQEQHCDDCEIPYFENLISSFILTASTVGLALGIKLFKLNHTSRQAIEDLRKSNAESELAFLKNQINPHFLFNALNSLHVLSKKKDDNLPDSILDLSDLLRYHLYDSDRDFIPLLKEMKFIDQYTQFEKMRRGNVQVDLDFQILNNSAEIIPLLLLPLVENAFKYSQRSDDEETHISVKLSNTKESISFYIENSKGNLLDKTKGKYSGIGLANVKRRLDLTYPNRHTLDISEDDEKFMLSLELRESK